MSARGARRGFSPWRDLPVVLWLVGVGGAAATRAWLPDPRWLMLHMLLLGALTHAVVVWSRHFTDAVLHAPVPAGDARRQARLLALLNVGAAAVMAGTQAAIWPLTLCGASAVAAAVGWHGLRLARRMRRALPTRFRPVVRYYLAAAALLPLGATLGVLLARDPADPWHARLLLAHVTINLLGWAGLTVAGTVLTLWPTVLRTRLDPGTDRVLRQALGVLAGSVVVAAGAALLGLRPLAALGLLGYLAGLALVALPLARTARRTPPTSFPAWSIAAGLCWWAVTVALWVADDATARGDVRALARFDGLVPLLAAGFAAQVLLGALGYLVPMALGGGQRAVRAANAAASRAGAARVVAVNAALLASCLPAPHGVRVACWVVVLLSLAASVPLLLAAVAAAHRARREGLGNPVATPATGDAGRPGRRADRAAATAGLAVVVLAVAVGAAAGGTPRPGAATAAAAPTGRTTTLSVRAEDMRFTPSVLDVPAGNRLVLTVVDADSQVHDLVLDTGARTGRLAPGQRGEVTVGAVTHDVAGWCSVAGHRQLGMTLTIRAVGSRAARASAATAPDARLDPAAPVPPGFTARDAALPPVTGGRVHRVTLRITEAARPVAPGVTQRLWTYGGTAPGPVLHGRLGDRFVVTLVNDGTMGHSIDFHAGTLAPAGPMRTIAPGRSLTYRFTATRAGIWLYHCSTMPMTAHIASGMFGAVVIDPPGLPAVARSYVLIQSEYYFGPQGGDVDPAKIAAGRPDAVVFNGYAFGYDHDPLPARVGERIRVWVLDAGPDRATSFHVVGGQFDTVFAEGAYLLRPGRTGSQALALAPGQGGFVELSFPQAGDYPFVSHYMIDAERGAHGLFAVRPR